MIGFNGGLVGKTRTPTTGNASGVWTSNEQANAQRSGIWPLGPADFVVSGLQLYLDAGKTSSYPGTGTTWTDLSGNSRNATLSNTTFDGTDGGGALIFNGSNGAAQVSGSITLTAATLMAFIKLSAVNNNYQGIIYNRSGVVSGIHCGGNTTLSLDWFGNTHTHNVGLPQGEWLMVAATVPTSGSVTFYQNRASAQTSSTSALGYQAQSTLDDIDIGQDDLGGRFFNGRIGIALVYNRALTSTEITTNWTAFRTRFGI